MTSDEWAAVAYPRDKLLSLKNKVSDRKMRWFVCACCRRVWHFLIDECSQRAVEAGEAFADDPGRAEDKNAALELAIAARCSYGNDDWKMASLAALEAVGDLSPARMANVARWTGKALKERGRQGERGGGRLVNLICCVFGDSFRPVTFDPTWLTPDVTAVARAAYDERQMPSGELEPSRLAVLADALEDSGCVNAELLIHLRSPSPHVRGCFAVDMCLGLT